MMCTLKINSIKYIGRKKSNKNKRNQVSSSRYTRTRTSIRQADSLLVLFQRRSLESLRLRRSRDRDLDLGERERRGERDLKQRRDAELWRRGGASPPPPPLSTLRTYAKI